MKNLLSALFLTIAFPATVWAGQSSMQPGLWEITTEMEMPGMPMKLPPQSIRHCYTAKELADGRNAVPQSGDGNCQVKNYRMSGNTASWEIECIGESAMHGKASMTISPTRYTGKMEAVMSSPGGDMKMTTHWRAHRIGDCR